MINEIRPFEEYKEMIQDTSKDELIEFIYELIKANNSLKEESYREKSLKELYKDRIDKAIFFLENSDYSKMRFGIDLLEILKGGNDE